MLESTGLVFFQSVFTTERATTADELRTSLVNRPHDIISFFNIV